VRDPLTEVTWSIELCAEASRSLTVFSNAETSGLEAQIGGWVALWATENTAAARNADRRTLNLNIKDLAKMEMKLRRCCSGKANYPILLDAGVECQAQMASLGRTAGIMQPAAHYRCTERSFPLA